MVGMICFGQRDSFCWFCVLGYEDFKSNKSIINSFCFNIIINNSKNNNNKKNKIYCNGFFVGIYIIW